MHIRRTAAAVATVTVTAAVTATAAATVTATATAANALVAAPEALAGPKAAASPLSAVEPGPYRIANGAGACLRGQGGHNAKVRVGACDTTWSDTTWSLERGGAGFTIVHAATRNCLATGLELIYPPFAATMPCETAPVWTIADADAGQVTISLTPGSACLTDAGAGEIARVGPADGPRNRRLWTLIRIADIPGELWRKPSGTGIPPSH